MSRQLCIYVDVDDTLVRSAGSKRIPVPAVIQHVAELHRDGALLYCWSSGGADYARQSAESLASLTISPRFSQSHTSSSTINLRSSGLSFFTFTLLPRAHSTSIEPLSADSLMLQPTSPKRCSELRSRSSMRGQRAIVDQFHMIRIGTSSWADPEFVRIHLSFPQLVARAGMPAGQMFAWRAASILSATALKPALVG